MSLRKIEAIISKQLKDTFTNKEVLIQFLLFPIFAFIMEYAIEIPSLPQGFFAKMFASIYIGMAPLVGMASIIAEEKEKNTLKVLMMSDVKAGEYLIGVGSYVWAACMLGSCALAAAGGYKGKEFRGFLGVMCVGIVISALVGAVIGTLSRNQMAATSVTVPVMMVFAFVPMISMFNSKAAEMGKVLYSQQIANLLEGVGNAEPAGASILILGINFLIVLVLFAGAYKKGYCQ